MAEGEGQELARVGRKEEDERSPEVVGCKRRKLRDLTSKDDISKARYPRSMKKKKLMVDGGGRLLISGQWPAGTGEFYNSFEKSKVLGIFIREKISKNLPEKAFFCNFGLFSANWSLCL